MTGPLHGMRIVDFTERVQGPYATQVLGDFGADVIKVERVSPLTPDGRLDERYPEPGEDGRTLYRATFLAHNRNKRSVAIDVKSEKGLRIAQRLIARADAIVENFRPGVMDRLGLGYAQTAELNPAIIYVSASGYGSKGPAATRPGQDLLVQAMSGMGAMNRSAAGRPTPVGMSVTDILGGLNIAIAAMAALVHRARTGEGQRVEVDLLGSAMAAMGEHFVHILNNGAGEPARGTVMHGHGYIPPPYGFYATRDGYLALSGGRQISQLSRILGIEDLEADPRFDTFRKRDTNRAEMEAVIEDALQQRTTEEWLALMEPEDIFVARVNSMSEALIAPQAMAMGRIVDVAASGGTLKLIGPAATFSKTPAEIRLPPPRHGEHTREILHELDLDASISGRSQGWSA